MKSIPIPLSTIQAYGATPVRIDPPQNFELDNGQPIESLLGMRVGDVTYVLMGIEEDERDALNRTNCFYIGFVSGFIPVFTVRVADIIHGQAEDPLEETLPIVFANFELNQEARTNWISINDHVVCKQIPIKSELRWDNEPGNQIIEAGDFLFHDFKTGQMMVVNELFAQMLLPEVENEETNNFELQQSNGNGENQEETLPEL